MSSAASKQHEATPQKLEKARREGQVAKSPVFTQSCQLVGIFCGLFISAHLFWSSSEMVLHYSAYPESHRIGDWSAFWRDRALWSTIVILGMGLLGVLFGEVLQVGIRVALRPLRLDFSRLNPVQGVQKVGKQLKESWFLIVKFLGAAIIVFVTVRAHLADVPVQWLLPAEVIGGRARSLATLFGLELICFFGLVGLIERIYKRAVFLKEQRMSDEEMKREWKDSEGDPQVKGHRRALQQELATGEIINRIKKTRVVVVKRRELSRDES